MLDDLIDARLDFMRGTKKKRMGKGLSEGRNRKGNFLMVIIGLIFKSRPDRYPLALGCQQPFPRFCCPKHVQLHG